MPSRNGSSWFEDSILDRELPHRAGGWGPAVEQVAEILRCGVDLATRVICWFAEVDPAPPGAAVALGLFRSLADRADSISSLVPEGQVESSRVLVRSMIDCYFQLAFLLTGDPAKKALWFRHARLEKQRRWHIQMLSEPNRRVELDADHAAAIAELDRALANAPFAEVQSDFTSANGRGRHAPDWYSYAGGPRSMRALARQVNRPDMYEHAYRFYSESVHAGDAINIYRKSGSSTKIKPLRHPEGIQQTAALAMTLLVGGWAELMPFLSPQRQLDLGAAYILIQGGHLRLHETQIAEFEVVD